MKIKHIVAIGFTIIASQVFAQDDLLNMMDSAPTKAEPVKATFKTTRILNGHSIEQVASRHLDFRINHRFGLLNSGYDQLYGLDYARIRLALEYGINDWAMVGIGRSNLGRKAWDYLAKFRLLRQTKDNSIPLSVSLLGTAAVDITKITNSTSLTDRTTYTTQILLARKFTEGISIQLTPTFIHRNQRETPNLANDLFALGVGGRIKITRRTSFNFEYFYMMNKEKVSADKLYNTLSLGFDIETGGHVFQVHFTNSLGLIEKDFIIGSTNRWEKGQVGYGFNISRTFSFR